MKKFCPELETCLAPCDVHILGLTAKFEGRAYPPPSHPALAPPSFPAPQRPRESSSNHPALGHHGRKPGDRTGGREETERGSSDLSASPATGHPKLAAPCGNWGSKGKGGAWDTWQGLCDLLQRGSPCGGKPWLSPHNPLPQQAPSHSSSYRCFLSFWGSLTGRQGSVDS